MTIFLILKYATSSFWVFCGCFLLLTLFFTFALKFFAIMMIGLSNPDKAKSLAKSCEIFPDDDETPAQEVAEATNKEES